MGYLANFIVYTLAMVGVMMLAVFVFKNSVNGTQKNGSKFLKVIDTMSLGPRKTLYIVSAGEEKFLIAGDVDKTSLISKLNPKQEVQSFQYEKTSSEFQETMETLAHKSSYIDKSIIRNRTNKKTDYDSVMKNLAERMRTGN